MSTNDSHAAGGGWDKAQAALRLGKHEEALLHLDDDIRAEPRAGRSQALKIQLLLSMGRREEANADLDRARAGKRLSPDALDALAFFARQLGRHQLSNELYQAAAAAPGADGHAWYNLATSERALGRVDAALEACKSALTVENDLLPAVLLRSELTKATELHNNVDDLRYRLQAHHDDRNRMFCSYALAKELHDLREYDAAFAAFAEGAAIRRRNLRYAVAEDEQKIARIQQAFAKVLTQGAPNRAGQHIFIVGLPRSGTTLVERILTGLPGVVSNGETDNFSNALLQSKSTAGGDVFARCAAAAPDDVRRRYEELAQRTDAPIRIIEKLPLNYLYVGAIASALPDATIIWVDRHPVDSCFAMFRILFAEAYPFSYDLHELARYYAAYNRLMSHWNEALPGRLVKVRYEELVAEPAAVGRDLARRCGLAWDDAALDLSRNTTPSLTASAVQVRQPIYRSSASLWKNYRTHLAPLARWLTESGIVIDE